MNIHKNARQTPLRRDELAVAVLGGTLLKPHGMQATGSIIHPAIAITTPVGPKCLVPAFDGLD